MLVYMTETRRGSPDGFSLVRYHQGRTYDIPHTLAAYFISKEWGLETADEELDIGINSVKLSDAEVIADIAQENLSAAESFLPLPNLAARGMPRPSTLVRLNDTVLFGEEVV